MRTANPTLNSKTFTKYAGTYSGSDAMTIEGTVNKTIIMFFILLASAGFTWNKFFNSWDASNVGPWMAIGGIGGFILALITIFNPEKAKITAPLYALFEGLFLGGLSATIDSMYKGEGLVIKAVMLTMGTLFSLLFLYKSKIIRATENFKLGIVSATGGIALLYLMSMLMGFFGVQMPLIHSSGIMGIGFSLFVVVIAALNLVLDFDFIEQGAKRGAPAFMEWYGAFGLMVTLIWLYIEILRLLTKLSSRD